MVPVSERVWAEGASRRTELVVEPMVSQQAGLSIPAPELSLAPGEKLPEPDNAVDHRESTRWPQVLVSDEDDGGRRAEWAGCGGEPHMTPLDSDLCGRLEMPGVARTVDGRCCETLGLE